MKGIITYGIFLWLMALLCSCSFSLLPKQKPPKPLPPDSSNVKRVDSLIMLSAKDFDWRYDSTAGRWRASWDFDSIVRVTIDTSDAPEPVVIPDNPLSDGFSDNSLIPALANERDYYRDKLFTAKDALAERDAIIQRLQEQGRQQAAHIEKLVALVQQVRGEVKPTVQAAEPENNNAALITGISMLLSFLIGKFFTKKPKA